jgi:hypothetical protein
MRLLKTLINAGFTHARLRLILGAFGFGACIVLNQAQARSVAWPSFGPVQQLLRLDGFTDALPDFVGPIDGSAELTIFTEGNHFPVLLPLVFDDFPAWCEETKACRANPRQILVVTLPQSMIIDILTRGGVQIGNAVIPVDRGHGMFPNLIMGSEGALRRLAGAGIAERSATIFARHRGLGLLVKKDLYVTDINSFASRARAIVMASESEAAARSQYRATLSALTDQHTVSQLFAAEIRSFPGRLGIQHRDVPYAILNNLADGGVIFGHLASFYAQAFPDRLSFVAVPAAEPFGETIAVARAAGEHSALTAAFETFFLTAARTAYPAAGFSAPETFAFGAAVDLRAEQ